MSEYRIARLEEQIAFQEDAIQKLDDALADQQQQLLVVGRQLELIVENLRKLETGQIPLADDEIPPHY